jgi:NAD-dependent dihydropyrimidine dehydrogenase PreA subunit
MENIIWFPTVSGFCDTCGGEFRCVGFCPRGVFGVVGDELRVVEPLNCVPGCANCAPTCPRGAITFPAGAACHQPILAQRKSPFKKVTCEKCGDEFLTDIEKKTMCFDCEKDSVNKTL